MKLLSLVLLIHCAIQCKAANYYFSSQSGDDTRTNLQAQNPATPWKTINKLNSFTNLHPGDSVLFKCGETFYGTLISNASGTLGNVILYGSYGAGANPIISGFTALSDWTLLNGSIYYASLDVANLNIVTVDGIVKGMGRYPNTGYMSYENHTNNTSITDNQLAATPNWTGAEVVIRKNRYILDRQVVTGHSGNTLTYNALATYGNNNAYSPLNGNGYFIQGHLSALDQSGEWYYDKTAKRLYMHFGSGTPSGRVIKASALDRNFTINSQNYISLNNLDFEGSNTNGGYLVGAHNITLNNCKFIQQGGNALYGISVSYITVNAGTITNALNNGIWVENNGSYITIDNTSLSDIGTIAGAGRSGDAAQEGIAVNGSNTKITHCSVIRTGYNGIDFTGNDALIEHNYVDSFCTVKDDGGGIYTYISDNGIIRNNTVLNAIGAYAGAGWSYWEPFGKAVGIYLDNGSTNHHAMVSGNTIAHGEWTGLFLNNNSGNTIVNNTVFDFAQQLLIIESSVGTVRNTTIKYNKFVGRTSAQTTLYNRLYVNDNPSLFGTIDSNYYARPIDDSLSIQTTTNGNTVTYKTLAGWQTYSGVDVQSHKSPKTITNVNDLKFEFNATALNKTIILTGNYMDVTGAVYNGNITLAPYSSAVLIRNYQLLPLTPSSLTGSWIGKKILLQWNTFEEDNKKSFEIERSINGISFKLLNSVKASNGIFNYKLIDDSPFLGNNYYRIKQVNNNGTFIYSKVLLMTHRENLNINIFPNPTSDNIQVNFTLPQNGKQIKLSIRNIQGVNNRNFSFDPSLRNVNINTSFLTCGTYILTLECDNFITHKQFIKQ